MPLRLGNGKAQRHDVEERRIAGRDTPAAKVVADGEAQFVAADRQRATTDQRLVGAAVGVRYSRLNTVRFLPGKLVELDGNAHRRPTGVGVEHMRAEAS